MSMAFIFPGQGSQFVGMGQDWAEAFPIAKESFEEVDETLKQNLSKLMFSGPMEDLTLTENTQPALMATSIAITSIMKKELGLDLKAKCQAVAGHSLGEYTALTAAESLTLSDAARLLRIRGQAMQNAVPVGQGAMAAVIGLDFQAVEDLVNNQSSEQVCCAANDNAPGQVVISGHALAVEQFSSIAMEAGARMVKALPVSAPFHCPLMQSAADKMQEALEATDIQAPLAPVYANVTAKPVAEADKIRHYLVEQVTGRVRWRETIENMKNDGIETLVEIGAGRVLTGLVKRIDRSLKTFNIQEPADLDQFQQEYM